MHVYCITNNINDKVYVGQHSKDDLEAYLAYNIRHALANSGNKTYLYRAIRKYSGDAFTIQSLISPIDKESMDWWEIFFIQTLGTQNPNIGYNITSGGGGRLGIKRPHTDAEKEHMSEVMMGRKVTWAHKISVAQKGRTFTPEHIIALKAGQKGNKKPSRSPEHSRKISEHRKLWWANKKAGSNA
jgi:group I intron endonuclease